MREGVGVRVSEREGVREGVRVRVSEREGVRGEGEGEWERESVRERGCER